MIPVFAGAARSMKNESIPEDVRGQLERLKAMHLQREQQQGLGRPIISFSFKGYRFVAVWSRLYFSPKWKTFHDFLMHYIKDILGSDWGNQELKKPFGRRHPILQWYELVTRYQNKHHSRGKEVSSVPMTGAISAYMSLAYNLYVIAHNIKLQARLIKRLKNIDNFRGAYYETFVAAWLVKAGFDVMFEDEDDSSTTHGDFIAIHEETKRTFHVEVKAREFEKDDFNVRNQLYEGLKKKSERERIIFIDMNVPYIARNLDEAGWLKEAARTVRQAESTMTINRQPAPPAYVILTNYPYEYNLEKVCSDWMVLAEGFKIPDFKWEGLSDNLRSALEWRKRHKEILCLLESIKKHQEIPSTFDGEIPEFAYGEIGQDRLYIGKRYLVPNQGNEVVGVLEHATVDEKDKKAMCVFRLQDGRQIICSILLSDMELAAYKRHPETFFGVRLKQVKKARDPLDLFDFFYENYKNCPRERLLGFLKNRPDFEKLKDLDNHELLIKCCEAWVCSAVTQK